MFYSYNFASTLYRKAIVIPSPLLTSISPMSFYFSLCTACNSGDIRLVNGNSPNEGRVEVCNEDGWGTVCDNLWTQEDANVACRQAGFSRFGEWIQNYDLSLM